MNKFAPIDSKYRIVEALGEGSQANVYLVKDAQGKNIALKHIRFDATAGIDFEQMKEEFRTLSKIEHPYISRVYDFQMVPAGPKTAAQFYFTMEYVKGSDLFKATRKASLEQILTWVLQTAYALDYLHRHRLLHRDIKPSHILIHEDGSRVTLVDFGLSCASSQKNKNIWLGTPEYLPPEILLEQNLDSRSDLYSFGLTLYKVFAGHLPFQTSKPSEILEKHRQGLSLDADHFNNLPPFLWEFILASTKRNPWERPLSLTSLIHQLREYLGSKFQIPDAIAPPPLGQAPLIGRADIMQRIFESSPVPLQVFVVCGEKGQGKSRLLREICHRFQTEERNVFLLHSEQFRLEHPMFGKDAIYLVDDFDEASADTWDFFSSLLERMYLKKSPQQKHSSTLFIFTVSSLPKSLFERWQSYPFLQQLTIHPITSAESRLLVQELLGQQQLPSGLKDYLFEVSQGNPLVLRSELDQLLLAGILSWRKGQYSWSQAQRPQTATPKEAERIFVTHFEKAPLEYRNILQELAVFGHGFTKQDLACLHRESSAWSDFLIWAREHQFLTYEQGRYAFQHKGLQRFLAENLTPETKATLHKKIVQVLDKTSFKTLADREKLAFHLKQSGDALGARATLLQIADLAEANGQITVCLESLSQAVGLIDASDFQVQTKLRLARLLVSSSRYDEALDLLHQLRRDHGLTVNLDLEATCALLQVFIRRGQYDQGLSLTGEFQKKWRLNLEKSQGSNLDPKTFVQFLGLMACCLIRRAEFVRAHKLLTTALKLARHHKDRRAETVLECHQGEMALERGFYKTAKQLYDRALLRLLHFKKLSADLRTLRLRASIHNNLGKIALALGKDETALRHFRESLTLSKTLSNPAEECITLIHLGNILYKQNRFSKSRPYYEDANQIAEFLGKPRERAMSLFNLGNIFFMTGHLQTSIDHYERSIITYQELGDQAGRAHAYAGLSAVYLEIGAFEKANSYLDQGENITTDQELRYQKAYLNLMRGVSERLRRNHAQSREMFRVAESQFTELDRPLELAQTKAEWAELEFEDSPKRHGQAKDLVLHSLATARKFRAQDLIVQNLLLLARMEVQKQRPYLAEAEKRAKTYELKNLLWRIYSLRNWTDLASSCLQEVASGLSDETRSIFWSDPRHQLGIRILEPYAFFPESTVKEMTLRLRNQALSHGISHFASIFEINRLLNSPNNLETLLDFILDTAIGLTRAHRAFLLEIDNKKSFHIRCARKANQKKILEPETAISQTIALKAIAGNSSVLTHDALADERFQKERSVNHLKLRSVLCVPLRNHNQITGVLYLDHPSRQGIFSQEEVRLLEVIADQASIAIENAQLREGLAQKVELQRAQLKEAKRQLRSRYKNYDMITGDSLAMQNVFHLAEKVMDSDMPVLIHGERGTGKELLAKVIHYNGPYSQGQFVSETCSALPPLLLENVLFGQGESGNRKGLFEIANGGTLFLNEIGSLSPPLQAKILQAFETGLVVPLGGGDPVPFKVRFIASSTALLGDLVQAGKFRKDLYYQLRGIEITMPSLRERREDIPHLVKHFLKEISERKLKISREALRLLLHYPWPGNVRELRSVLERAVLTCGQDEIRPDDLPQELREQSETDVTTTVIPFLEAKKSFEREYLQDLLRAYEGNITRAAAATGLYRQYLHRLLKKHKLEHMS